MAEVPVRPVDDELVNRGNLEVAAEVRPEGPDCPPA